MRTVCEPTRGAALVLWVTDSNAKIEVGGYISLPLFFVIVLLQRTPSNGQQSVFFAPELPSTGSRPAVE